MPIKVPGKVVQQHQGCRVSGARGTGTHNLR
jgi:hypothetical protein